LSLERGRSRTEPGRRVRSADVGVLFALSGKNN